MTQQQQQRRRTQHQQHHQTQQEKQTGPHRVPVRTELRRLQSVLFWSISSLGTCRARARARNWNLTSQTNSSQSPIFARNCCTPFVRPTLKRRRAGSTHARPQCASGANMCCFTSNRSSPSRSNSVDCHSTYPARCRLTRRSRSRSLSVSGNVTSNDVH